MSDKPKRAGRKHRIAQRAAKPVFDPCPPGQPGGAYKPLTEAELQAMTDAGKAALYLRSILAELNLTQLKPTTIQVDNRAARQFTNAQQPTRRTRHIEMRDFVIVQWTDEEQIRFQDVKSQYNPSDSRKRYPKAFV